MNKRLRKLRRNAISAAIIASLTFTPALVYAGAGDFEEIPSGDYSNVKGEDGRQKGFDVEDKNLGGAQIGNGMGSSTGDSALDNKSNTKCPNTQLLSGKLLTATCWSCLFPMVTMGISVSIGGDEIEMPEARSKKVTCKCPDKNGLPYFGTLYSLWNPAKVAEFVRASGCLATLNGTQMNISRIGQGMSENMHENPDNDGIFMHYHYYSFPLLILLKMMNNMPNCMKDNYVDIDVLFFSEVDPTWNDDTLAFFTQLEVVLFNNPVGILACLPDAISSTVLRRPIESLFWCAGSWGQMYPFTGKIAGDYDGIRGSSLMLAKMLSALHRRGMLLRTYGDDYQCEGIYTARMPKGQYKFTMLYPVPETHISHVIGESELVWGTARKVPMTGEDFVYLVWNWNDCCLAVLSVDSVGSAAGSN